MKLDADEKIGNLEGDGEENSVCELVVVKYADVVFTFVVVFDSFPEVRIRVVVMIIGLVELVGSVLAVVVPAAVVCSILLVD